jgi:hypothetical protein
MTLIYPIALGRPGMIGRLTSFPILPVGAAAFVGAFDAIANLVHVYCIARRWLSAYTGRLVRLRRSSDSVEADFTYDADGNLDVAAVAAWAGGSAFVVVVADQKSGDDVSQGTAGNQPLFVASGQNGRAVGRYNGTSQFLRGTYTVGGALSQPFSIYAAARASALGTNFILDGDPPNTQRAAFFHSGSKWIFAGASLAGSATNTNWLIWSALFSGASSQLWINGTSNASGNAGNLNPTGITIGANVNSGQFWLGDIATVTVADPNNDTTARQAVEATLGAYWDIP